MANALGQLLRNAAGRHPRFVSALAFTSCLAMFAAPLVSPPDWAHIIHTGYMMEGVSLDDMAEMRRATHGQPAAAAAEQSAALQQQQQHDANAGPAAGTPSHPYLRPVPDLQMATYRLHVESYLASAEFRSRVDQIRQRATGDGILINAGGPKLLTNLLVLLKVLRRHLNSTLPVEVAWQGPAEMDDVTLRRLDEQYGPVTGFDVSQLPYPQHHRRVAKLAHWPAKVFALLACRFRRVLLLDADNLPLQDPAPMFGLPQFARSGFLMWSDAWSNWVTDGAFQLLGLEPGEARAALQRAHARDGSGGGGGGVATAAAQAVAAAEVAAQPRRDAESGAVLVDMAAHADVLEYLWWANSFSERLYHRHLHGDKDTFPLAFAAAGKAHCYRQVATPPGGAFQWGRKVLEVKGSGGPLQDGWQLVGWWQPHPHTGRPLLFHRTMNKWQPPPPPPRQPPLPALDLPWPIQALTGPLPTSWCEYYLAHDTKGPTKGAWWEHVVPDTALALVQHPALSAAGAATTTTLPVSASGAGAALYAGMANGACPPAAMRRYAALVSAAAAGVPLAGSAAAAVLQRRCWVVAQRQQRRSAIQAGSRPIVALQPVAQAGDPPQGGGSIRPNASVATALLPGAAMPHQAFARTGGAAGQAAGRATSGSSGSSHLDSAAAAALDTVAKQPRRRWGRPWLRRRATPLSAAHMGFRAMTWPDLCAALFPITGGGQSPGATALRLQLVTWAAGQAHAAGSAAARYVEGGPRDENLRSAGGPAPAATAAPPPPPPPPLPAVAVCVGSSGPAANSTNHVTRRCAGMEQEPAGWMAMVQQQQQPAGGGAGGIPGGVAVAGGMAGDDEVLAVLGAAYGAHAVAWREAARGEWPVLGHGG